MIGLPTETDDDIKGIASLAQRAYDRAKKATPPEARGSVKVSISCALFVPKAQTPFQRDGQITTEEAHRRINLLRSSVKYRAVDVHWHEPDVSLVEAMMAAVAGERCAMSSKPPGATARALTHGPSFSRLIRGERRA